MIEFKTPLKSYEINLNTVICVKRSFVDTEYSCVIIDNRRMLGKYIVSYTFVDKGGNYYRSTDWGDGKIYYIRKISKL